MKLLSRFTIYTTYNLWKYFHVLQFIQLIIYENTLQLIIYENTFTIFTTYFYENIFTFYNLYNL